MNYKILLKIHLVLAAFFLSFLLVLPLSGGLYLLGEKGSTSEKLLFITGETKNLDRSSIESLLQENKIDHSFEYIKKKGNSLILRPSHREHIVIKKEGDNKNFYLVKPNFIKSLVEIHKGHGPRLLKSFQIASALGLLLITISGLILLVKRKSLTKDILISFLSGAFIFIALCFI